MPCCLERLPALAAFLNGERASWSSLGISEADLLSLSESEDLSGLLHHRVSALGDAQDWPPQVRGALAEEAHAEAAVELLRAAETRSVLTALADAGIGAILLKGTPLAYSVYATPVLRPRSDTDLLIQREAVDAARRVMAALGYATTVHCNDLFSQFEVQKQDSFGVRHAFDIHWNISGQPVFADVLAYDELLSRAQPVEALGPHALTLGPIDALLLACIHPVMHHRNEQRALWVYDIHLLASRLSLGDVEKFVELALSKKMAAVTARGLRTSRQIFNTKVPSSVLSRLSSPRGEPSAAYLEEDRRWHHELISSVRSLPTLSDRLKWLREVLFPSPAYMLGAYGLRGKPLAAFLLPALYLYRNVFGVLKIVAGKK